MSKILWVSNAVYVPSGYGVQSRLFCLRAVADGHEVINFAFYGHGGPAATWNNILVLPRSKHGYGEDMLIPHYEHHKPDHMVMLMDIWPYAPEVLDKLPLTAWVPIDHDPAPPQVIDRLKHVKHIWSMSRFGEAKLKEAGLTSTYVPHGVDTNAFKPVDGLRASARARMGIDEADFLAVMVAANKGWPSRKNIPEVLAAWATFIKTHPTARLYLHTDVGQDYGGLDVVACASFYGIPAHNLIFPNAYQLENGMHGDGAMNALYNAADVKLLPSAGEGFGVPVIEAQACFPAGTEIQASGVVRGMSRKYTGEMVTITTARGSFEATANHPIWTKTGWKHAGDVAIGDEMLYTLSYHNEGEQHANQGLSEVYTGTIDHLVRRLQADAPEGGRESGWHDVPSRNVAGAPIRLGQSVRGYFASKGSSVKRGSVSLYRWLDRWRGLNSGAQDARWQGEAFGPHSEHRYAPDGLAHVNVERAVNIHHSFAQAEAGQTGTTPVSHRGIDISAALRGTLAVPRYQTRANGTYDRVVRNTPRSDENGPVHREAAIHHAAHPAAQYENVTAVARRSVTDLPVYNLTTESGTYTAGGYLVHNCGCPVIVTDATAQAELAGPGYKIAVDPDDWVYTLQRSHQARVRPSRIVEALEWALEQRGNADLRAKAREFAMQYDADHVWTAYMKPALEAQKAAKDQLEAERASRTAARLEARSQAATKAEEVTREPQTLSAS